MKDFSQLHTVLCDQENNNIDNRLFFLAFLRMLQCFLGCGLAASDKIVLSTFLSKQSYWFVLWIHPCSHLLNCHICTWVGDARKSMPIRSWKEEWVRFAHRSEVYCGILTSPHCCRRHVETTLLHEYYWQRQYNRSPQLSGATLPLSLMRLQTYTFWSLINTFLLLYYVFLILHCMAI